MAAPHAATAPAGAAGAGRSGWLARAWAANGAGYMFLLPWLIGFLVLTLGPSLISLYLSFTNFDLLRPPTWIGAENYERMFTADAKFMASMRVTLFFVIFSVPLKLAFALAVAVALNRGIQGSRNTGIPMTYGEAYQTLFPRVVTETLG